MDAKVLTPKEHGGSVYGDYGYEIDGVKSADGYVSRAAAERAMHRKIEKLERERQEKETGTKIKTCRECHQPKPHRRIDKEQNRVTGPARVWAAVCVDCAARPVCVLEYNFRAEAIEKQMACQAHPDLSCLK